MSNDRAEVGPLDNEDRFDDDLAKIESAGNVVGRPKEPLVPPVRGRRLMIERLLEVKRVMAAPLDGETVTAVQVERAAMVEALCAVLKFLEADPQFAELHLGKPLHTLAKYLLALDAGHQSPTLRSPKAIDKKRVKDEGFPVIQISLDLAILRQNAILAIDEFKAAKESIDNASRKVAAAINKSGILSVTAAQIVTWREEDNDTKSQRKLKMERNRKWADAQVGRATTSLERAHMLLRAIEHAVFNPNS